MPNNEEHNELVVKLIKNGTIFIPIHDYEIIKIYEKDTYYQIWYKYDVTLTSSGRKRRPNVSWVKVLYKDINKYLRTEKLKKLTSNVTNR